MTFNLMFREKNHVCLAYENRLCTFESSNQYFCYHSAVVLELFIFLQQILASNLYLRCSDLFINCVFAFQATAEQMRLAQVIFDKNDSEFEAKVKQVSFWQRILFWH